MFYCKTKLCWITKSTTFTNVNYVTSQIRKMVFFKYRYVYQNTQSKLPLCAFAMIKSTSLLVPVSWNKKWCIAKKYFLDYNDIIIPWRLHRAFKNVSRVIFHANEPIFHLCHLCFSQTGKIHHFTALIWSVTSGLRRPSPLTCAVGHAAAFAVNAALGASRF